MLLTGLCACVRITMLPGRTRSGSGKNGLAGAEGRPEAPGETRIPETTTECPGAFLLPPAVSRRLLLFRRYDQLRGELRIDLRRERKVAVGKSSRAVRDDAKSDLVVVD